MNNEPYYGVTRTDEYLAHYGIKGMKWGVRKARESGNTRALGRQYRKAQRKLAKLEARAANGKKYAKRAAALGAGAAAAGGLAVAGTGGVSRLIRSAGSTAAVATRNTGRLMSRIGNAAYEYGRTPGNRTTKLGKLGTRYGKMVSKAGESVSNAAGAISPATRRAATAVSKWGNTNSGIQTLAGRKLEEGANRMIQAGSGKIGRKLTAGAAMRTRGFEQLEKARGMQYTNNQLARVGAAALGAGLAGGAAYNAYRAATTKRAARKAAQFRSEMNKAFAGTQYDRRRKKNRRG